MRALSKLINLNKPDLVLFVGEALVGNDAVDQLTKFDQVLISSLQLAIANWARDPPPRSCFGKFGKTVAWKTCLS